MRFIPTQISDIIIIEPNVHGDQRGFFMETFHAQRFANAGIDINFVQDNHSCSSQGTLRGLHYQIQQTQSKLIRVVAGEVYDVAVDLRKSSKTFGQWIGVHLSAENKRQVWIPKGFAHGFYVISPQAEVIYKVDDYYAPEWERTLLWNDPALDIRWPLLDGIPPILSPKDTQGLPLEKAELLS